MLRCLQQIRFYFLVSLVALCIKLRVNLLVPLHDEHSTIPNRLLPVAGIILARSG